MRYSLTIAMAALLGVATASAQTPRKNQISANPFGLLLELANAEFEHVVSESATMGVGGSMFGEDNDDYINADVFYRYYPSARPLEGWAFGAKIGVTSLDNEGTRFGYGFDVNHSWILGRNHNFYVGVGFGLKKLVGGDDDGEFDLDYIPTLRIINVGIAF